MAETPHFIEEVRASFARQRVMALIGASLTRLEAGAVDITLPYRADLTQQNGFIHAGVITTIADSACGYAAYSLMPPESDILTVEFKINLLRPAAGERFVAEGRVLRPGAQLTVARAEVMACRGDERVLIAAMQATLIRLVRDASSALPPN
jgi:uncharacterized protein (TIGR00369 family)